MKFKILIVFCLFSLSSCMTLEEYQKAKLNQETMKLENSALDSFESDFESYREGAVGGNNGNKGGGCGCN